MVYFCLTQVLEIDQFYMRGKSKLRTFLYIDRKDRLASFNLDEGGMYGSGQFTAAAKMINPLLSAMVVPCWQPS